MTIIDLSRQIDDIIRRYPEFCHSDEARRELQALWGGVDCNDYGLFVTSETIPFVLKRQKYWYGHVRITEAPNGWHAVSTSYGYGQGGGGSSPSICNRSAYTTRDEAVAAGVNELIATFEGIRDYKGTRPDCQPILAQRMIEALKVHLSQAR